MREQLSSLSKLFTEHLFRIPDFQRGFAWSIKEVEEFWHDLVRLKTSHNHYVGVLTLEKVDSSVYTNWYDDNWMISSRGYTPFYVVDGQQRLTTSIILLSAIVDTMVDKGIDRLNFTSREKIIEKFLYEGKDETSNKSYLFCYEKDNPSYSFLISEIFNQADIVSDNEYTVYTNNLFNAKKFFMEKLSNFDTPQLEEIYSKITQKFLFNIYEISEDIDVYVSFETMNNRGKPLSSLELLKNRLIYISSLFNIEESEQARLRDKINTCWKNIYHYLGLKRENPLSDNEFLFSHFNMYFCDVLYEKYKKKHENNNYHEYDRMIHSNYLLRKYFIPENIETEALKTKDVYDYLSDLNKSIIIWSTVNNPDTSSYTVDIKDYLHRINLLLKFEHPYYMDPDYFRLSYIKLLNCKILLQEKNQSLIKKYLKTVERYLFIKLFYPYEVFYHENESISFEDCFYKYTASELTCEDITKKIETFIKIIISKSDSSLRLVKHYSKSGFYDKKITPYILWEYEKSLQKQSKNNVAKIGFFNHPIELYNSIEHIYPQNPKSDYWKTRFNYSHYNRRLRNSIGNLLMISGPKNTKLENKPFPEKCCNKDNNVGYKFGSYSEMEVAQEPEWNPDSILKRGIKILQFINQKWELNIKKSEFKKILGFDFLSKK